ncbi:putative glycosyltransferase [Dyadobacter sp. CECT 9275]|uniref:Glycosyltransferase n=1 Tax=Dyadobacter helix TaxID=2822344 RepID=A0A916N5S3_9BACT|nr:glycosyltransferase family 2 protein [Dyadobacter sp. CECT 9275]CAG4999697.1 putative glycosyltransferase [Dyadobacter sp. CECT 9275]
MLQLSLITINLNNKEGLLQTIRSVLQQSFESFEYIIIDGGSTDGSLDIIRENSAFINYWTSEPDNGIYHAMNKGINVAKGKYCLFLNSGDWLSGPEILRRALADQSDADIISGDIYFYDNVKQAIKWLVPSPDQVTAKTLFLGTLPHQATFIKRSLFDTIGLYNEQLRITSDWLFFLEALFVFNCTYLHYTGVIAYFNMDGISCDPRTELLRKQEQLRILQQKYPLFLPDYELLNRLENQTFEWLESREFRVYKSLENMGVIRFGVFCQRITRAIQRKLHLTINR